jgi:hypothetical protein
MKNVFLKVLIVVLTVMFTDSAVNAASMKVKVTAYNNMARQTDSTPDVPACGGTVYSYGLPQLAVNPSVRRALGINKCFAELLVDGERHIVTDVKGAGGVDKLILCSHADGCKSAHRAAKNYGDGKGHKYATIIVLTKGQSCGRNFKHGKHRHR